MNVLNFEKAEASKLYRVEVLTIEGETPHLFEHTHGVHFDSDDGTMWIMVSDQETVVFNLQNVVMLRVTEEV